MNHNIKIKHACRLAGVPVAAILPSITPDLIDRLTARELAAVMVALNAHWQKALLWKEREIVGNGFAWDESRQKLRDLAA
jgi:hypothetical protein